ncbi:MAG: c-type cytochrome [Saprospiraceae bacterium]|nr:c-type cytochrome [Saprospiraceae bacterium]
MHQTRNTIDYLLLGFMPLLILSSCNNEKSSDEFVLHPDFEISLVASDPLIFDPVDLEFDAKGDAYVLQMPGYPKGIDQSSIIKLVDSDNDGLYDQRYVYAENLAQASSFMSYKNGFLVSAPPELLFVADTDGDGVSDQRSVIMNGFSNGNLQHNFNGLTYGLDNWIHIANGGNGGEAKWLEADNAFQISGYDFQIRPETHEFEISNRTSGGYELAMDQWGNFYGTHNLHHINMAVFPQRYINGLDLIPRNTLLNISDHEENGLARVYPIGEQETRVNHPEQSGYFSGACGITYYGGGSYSPEFEGNIFVNDVVLNLVHRDVLREEGSVNMATRARKGVDFLASRDRSFRPVNSTVGPDGALYIVDMYRKVIEHPEWIPDELEVNMDLDAGKNRGRIFRITEKGKNLFTWQEPDEDINAWAKLLQHPNLWQRITAQRIILEKKWDGIDLLTELFGSSEMAASKIQILYTLQGMGADLQPVLLKALDDSSTEVQRHAIILSELYLADNAEIRGKIISKIKSAVPRVRMQTALSLSTLPQLFNNEILGAVTEILNEDIKDPYVRMACVIACKNQPLALATYLSEKPTQLDREGIQVILEMVAGRLTQLQNSSEMLALIKMFKSDDALIQDILTAYGRSGLKISASAKRDWSQVLSDLEGRGSLAVLAGSWQLRKSLELPETKDINKNIDKAMHLIKDASATEAQKIMAARLLAFAPLDVVEQSLYHLIDTRNPVKLQEAALDVLEGFKEMRTLDTLINRWSTLSPTVRKRITDLLIYNPDNHDLLFASLESGKLNMSEFNFDLERRRRLLRSKDENTRKRAESLFSDAGVVQRSEAIEKMRPALEINGDVNAGQEVFKLQCTPCHRFGSLGNVVGPDLTEISRKSKETLMHDILDPNAGANSEYINHIIELNDGQVISGIIDQETDEALFVKMMGGIEKNIPKNEIKSINSTGLSLMPEGLEGVMSQQQFADLLTFLQKPVE